MTSLSDVIFETPLPSVEIDRGELMFRENLAALQWLYRISVGNRIHLFFSILLAVAGGGVSLVPPWVVYRMSIPLLQGAPLPAPVWQLPLVALIAIVLRYALQFAATILSHMVAFRLYKRLRQDIITHLGRLPMGFFSARSSGAIRKILGEDIENLEIFIGHHVPDTAKALAVPVMVFSILGWRDILFTLCIALPLFFAAIALTAMYRSQKGRMKEYHDNVENMNGAVVEYIKSMPIVKIYNVTMDSYRQLKRAIDNQVEIASSWARVTTPFYVLFKVGLDSALLFLMPCAIVLAAHGAFDARQWLLALVLGMAMLGPIEQIYTSSSLLASLVEGITRIDGLLHAPSLEMPQHPELPEHFTIEFKNVGFSYEGGQALDGVSMVLKEGQFHAFVGESGSGKSTAAQLLLRFWDVERGAILVGGKDVRRIPFESLMSMVAFVFQDSFMLEASVADNIALGCPQATREEVAAAARLAQADAFIQRLDHGYDTLIGTGGIHLSGGEKQRISIARALLKDSPILVLDEATSSNDPENQLDISKAIMALDGRKTVILITHHLSSAVCADAIHVFCRGRLTGSGRHEQLLRDNPEYQRIWENAASSEGWALAAAEEEERHAGLN